MRNIIRTPAVVKKTGLSRSTIYRKYKSGEFPAPVVLGPGAVGWFEHEIDEYLTTLPRGNAETPTEAITSRKTVAS